jgi:hypothetical protein
MPLNHFGSGRGLDPKLNRSDGKATCDGCSNQFDYYLIHNGFGDTAYAYCELCGMTTLLSAWAANIPQNVALRVHQPIAKALEKYLCDCECGGRFRAHAMPRCPSCQKPLSALSVTESIEADAPGTKAGWRWQQNWEGIHAIVIENRVTRDNWCSHETESDA